MSTYGPELAETRLLKSYAYTENRYAIGRIYTGPVAIIKHGCRLYTNRGFGKLVLGIHFAYHEKRRSYAIPRKYGYRLWCCIAGLDSGRSRTCTLLTLSCVYADLRTMFNLISIIQIFYQCANCKYLIKREPAGSNNDIAYI